MTQDDTTLSGARRAVSELEQLAAVLVGRAGDSVDGRRLQADVGRLRVDLDLLCGAAPLPEPRPEPPTVPAREVIPDTSYTHDFWLDAEDEGLGQYGGRGR